MHLAIGGVALCLYLLAWQPWPYVDPDALFGFPVIDTLGNSLGTVALAFAAVGFFGRGGVHDIFLIRCAMIGVLLYELMHPLMGKVIDPWDLLATVVAGWLSERLYRLLHPGVVSPLVVTLPAEVP